MNPIVSPDPVSQAIVNELSIVPNPFNNRAQIVTTVSGRLVILDALGSTIIEREIVQGNNEILASELNQSGIYFVILYANTGEILTQKLVFEN